MILPPCFPLPLKITKESGADGGEDDAITFGSFGTLDVSDGTEAVHHAPPTPADGVTPVAEGDGVQGRCNESLFNLAHPNPFGPLVDAEEDGGTEHAATGSGVAAETDVPLAGTIWSKWTRSGKEKEVCLCGTVWKKWTRIAAAPGGWFIPAHSGKSRSWKRTGHRRSRHKTRRRRERRRRQALRHKKRHRRGRMIKCRRRRVSLRGGAETGTGTNAPPLKTKSGRNVRKPILDKIDSIREGNAVNANHAGNASAIHKTNGWDASEQERIAEIRKADIEKRRKEVEAAKLARERIERLSTKDRAAAIGDLMAFANMDDPGDDPVCVACKQHFDDEHDKISCDTCDDSWHPGCVEPTPSDDSSDDDETVRFDEFKRSIACEYSIGRVCPVFLHDATHSRISHHLRCSALSLNE